MRSVDSWLDRFCSKHPRLGIPNLMVYFIAANIVVYLLDLFSQNMASAMLALSPALILQGEVWRLVTFVLVPANTSLVWFLFSLLFYYFMGSTMEREWGATKFTLFYLTGALLTILAAFISYLIYPLVWPLGSGLYYIHRSLFLAFATLFPNAAMRFYFIIPIKAKWLAVLWLALEVLQIIWYGRSWMLFLLLLLPLLSAIVNYLLYFWSDMLGLFGYTRVRYQHQTSQQTINFKKAQKIARETKGYLHKCSVCGITDTENPKMEFRYCSKCNGYHCYCMDHINNHTHVQ